MSNLCLEAKNVWKIYGDSNESLEVLRGVNLKIYAGDFISIRGSSGAGKSTLLQILGSLDQPSQGEVHFQGKNIFALKSRELDSFRLNQIGFIFQFHHLLPELNCLENVLLPARLKGSSVKESLAYGMELLERVGLQDRASHLPSELSGGERQRAAVARALINKPTMVFADEPTGNLDEGNSKNLQELFLSLNQELQQTFVVVTHEIDLANCASRPLEMHQGLIA